MPYPHSGRRGPAGVLDPVQPEKAPPKPRSTFSPSDVPQQTWYSILDKQRDEP